MPADLPVEEPARRVTGGVTARASHAWNRTFPWDAYFAVVYAATMVFVLSGASLGTGRRVAAAGLFTLLVPWYIWVGRPALLAEGENQARSLAYVAGTVLLMLPPAVLVGETRIATFALAPQCFMLLSVRWALTAVSAMNIVPMAGWALLSRSPWRDLSFNILFTVVTVAFAGVLGNWVVRIVDQSKDRAELINELDASREEVAQLSAAHGALIERERMSREIHDTLAQGFTSLLMLAQAVESELDRDPAQARRHVELIARTARNNLAEARALVAGRAPTDLDGTSLPDAIRRLTDLHSQQVGIPASVDVSGPVRPLPAGIEVVALRVCQEALANARKHAGSAAGVAVTLTYAEDNLAIAVRDSGNGFDPHAPQSGYGLRGLRARVAEIGGNAQVRSVQGEGTTVTADLFLPAPSRSPK